MAKQYVTLEFDIPGSGKPSDEFFAKLKEDATRRAREEIDPTATITNLESMPAWKKRLQARTALLTGAVVSASQAAAELAIPDDKNPFEADVVGEYVMQITNNAFGYGTTAVLVGMGVTMAHFVTIGIATGWATEKGASGYSKIFGALGDTYLTASKDIRSAVAGFRARREDAHLVAVEGQALVQAVDNALTASGSNSVSFGNEDARFVVADLAGRDVCLAAINKLGMQGAKPNTIVFRPLRPGATARPDTCPAAVATDASGNSLAIWQVGNDVRIACYGSSGSPRWEIDTRQGPARRDDPTTLSRMQPLPQLIADFKAAVRDDFQRTAQSQAAIAYDPDRQNKIEKAGTVMIVDKRSGRPHNDLGPAMITAAGEPLYFINGQKMDQTTWQAEATHLRSLVTAPAPV